MKSITVPEILGEMSSFESKNAPKQLFYEGNISLVTQKRKVSVVGSRKVSAQGKLRAEAISRMLVEKGFIVLSGLAEGVDTSSHTTAIKYKGDTIAVIGTPLNKAYPKMNEDLQTTIKRDHLCISQFPEGYPIQPKNFVIRNRTMALISDATIIVEAGEKSGTKHQGWEALRLGRTLLLMENLVENKALTWPKEMLKYGAQVLTRENSESLLDEIPNLTSGESATF